VQKKSIIGNTQKQYNADYAIVKQHIKIIPVGKNIAYVSVAHKENIQMSTLARK